MTNEEKLANALSVLTIVALVAVRKLGGSVEVTQADLDTIKDHELVPIGASEDSVTYHLIGSTSSPETLQESK